MLIIEGGRKCLYQWDIDQRLEVTDDRVVEVHFANAVTSPALVCEVYEEGGHRFADVPNILLQQFWPIQAYGYCGHRVHDVLTCKVIRRERPADYVYTETEVKTYEGLKKRIEALEEGGGSGGGGVYFETDETLTLKGGVLSVNTTDEMEEDNTLPITSAGVYTAVGNINALLGTI